MSRIKYRHRSFTAISFYSLHSISKLASDNISTHDSLYFQLLSSTDDETYLPDEVSDFIAKYRFQDESCF